MLTISQALDETGLAYLTMIDDDGDVVLDEIQTSDYWVIGNEDGWVNDSNVYFDNSKQVEGYYKSVYPRVFVFESYSEAKDKCTELERENYDN